MPGLVTEYIRPLLPYVSDRTLHTFDQDITDQKYTHIGYGDKDIDAPVWLKFHHEVLAEEMRRGLTPYRR